MWTSLLHFLTAITGLVNLVWHISPFVTQIFEFFIGTTFIFESIRDLVEPLHLGDESYTGDRSGAYASLVIGMLTFTMCWRLHFAETWTLFSRYVCRFMLTYGVLLTHILYYTFPRIFSPQRDPYYPNELQHGHCYHYCNSFELLTWGEP